MHALLREQGEASRVDLAQLDDDIRWGRVAHDAELLYGPWTGESYKRLDEIPELADALDSPNARFARHLREARTPWLSVGLALLVFLAAVVQSVLTHAELDGAVEALNWWLRHGAVGAEPTLLLGMWWTPWTSQLTHAREMPLFHMLFNIPLIAYCGFRVERAIGRGGFTWVAMSAVSVATLLIVLWSELPVVGSSILAYGLWAAQITIGWKMGEAVPIGWKGRYGWGNFKFFAPLYAANLFAADVSHLGHLGGIVGGGLAVLLIRSEATRPRGAEGGRRLRNHALALTQGLGLVALLVALPKEPALAYTGYVPVELNEAGARLRVPRNMAANEVSGLGFQGWKPGRNLDDAVFGALRLLRGNEPLEPDYVGDFWRRVLGGDPVEVDAPEALGAGWWVVAYDFVDPQTGEVFWHLVEHQHYRGRWVLRVGYYYKPSDVPDPGARVRLFEHVLQSLEVGDPPELVIEREKHQRNPTPSRTYDYANALIKAGEFEEGDALLLALSERTDGWAWDAARRRLTLMNQIDALAERSEPAWLDPFLADAPLRDGVIHYQGVPWLVARGDCARATAHVAGLEALAAEESDQDAEVERMLGVLRQELAACL